jgi:hypothetical protein
MWVSHTYIEYPYISNSVRTHNQSIIWNIDCDYRGGISSLTTCAETISIIRQNSQQQYRDWLASAVLVANVEFPLLLELFKSPLILVIKLITGVHSAAHLWWLWVLLHMQKNSMKIMLTCWHGQPPPPSELFLLVSSNQNAWWWLSISTRK